MKEQIVISSVFLGFGPDGVSVLVQQEQQIVRDDGSVAATELLAHQSFSMNAATPEQRALLKKALGTALTAQTGELHATRAKLGETQQHLSGLEAVHQQALSELESQRKELRQAHRKLSELGGQDAAEPA